VGVDIEKLKDYLISLRQDGVRIILDSRSLSISDIEEIEPWLIKPNAEEVSHYLNRDIRDISSAISAVKELSRFGSANVIISLGEFGAVLSANGRILTADTPKIDAISTIGAGDSMIAGFISAEKEEKDIGECFRYAVAFGTAACLSEGSTPPEKSKILSLLNEIQIHEEN
jgi:fructose-1-phosphate kinase PfkB-like protein